MQDRPISLETFSAFAAGTLDRAAHLRGDAAALAELASRPDARTIAIWRGKPLFEVGGPGLALADAAAVSGLRRPSAEPPILLGLQDRRPVFAADVSALGEDEPATPEGAKFVDLRAAMPDLGPADAGLVAAAKALIEWHATHPRCSRCGAPTVAEEAGWRRGCPECGAQHFPRTDPVVIMLIVRGDRVLLGRSAHFLPGMYSLLAGFIEPGETIEAAVRRETLEETAIPVGRVRYIASQPWPFPTTLMIGCMGEALADAITIDPAELEDALWVPKAEVAEAIAGRHPRFAAAREGAIARSILSAWVAGAIAEPG